MHSSPPRPDRLRLRARVLLTLLGLTIIASVGATGVELDHSSVLDRLAAGEDVSFERVEAADTLSLVTAIVQGVLWLATVVAFIAWLHRARSELDAVGAPGQRYGRGWTIGAWFVPFVNLVLPKKIINDVWRGAAPPDSGDTRVRALLHWWWGAWLIGLLVDNGATQAYLQAETLTEQQDASGAVMAANVWLLVAAVLALLSVRAVTARVRARVQCGPAGPPDSQPWTPEAPEGLRPAPIAGVVG